MANYEPCSICEEYIEGVICNNDKCPVGMMKAENKRLQKEKYKLQKALNQSEDYRAIAKSEAIEEFAERLKSLQIGLEISGESLYYVPIDCIDNLVKEVTEQRKEDENEKD